MAALRSVVVAAVALCNATTAQAEEVTVKVDARAMPWHPGQNPKLVFGRVDGRAPAAVVTLRLVSGTILKFRATGSTSTIPGGGRFGPNGQADYITNADPGVSGTFFPSKFMDSAHYPVRLNQLVGAFTNADGRVVGKPFPIGETAEIVIPEGAVAVTLGINDDIFADNDGQLTVTITSRQGRVILEQ